MARILLMNPATATGEIKTLFDRVRERWGTIPNMIKVMANAPAALSGYLSFGSALRNRTLDAAFREQIALAVAQANSSQYCLSFHTATAKMMELSEGEIAASRRASSEDRKKMSG